MGTSLQLTVQAVDGEPRVHDLMLAERLAFERPRKIRELIERNMAALERHGTVCPMVGQTPGGGRPSTEYWLNEAQALLICTKSETAVAEEVTSEVIRVFIAWRQGTLMPASSQVTLTSIGELFEAKLVPLHRDIANVRLEITEVQKNVIFISKRVDDIVPRRDFTEEARRQFKRVAAEKYDNECPCCRQTKLTHGEYQYDHYLGRELRDPEHGWITCKKCNLRMASDAMFKASRRPHFEVFQDYRRQMFGDGPPPKSRKGSPTSSSSSQGNLFS
jgi:hypothetical protein